MKHKLLIEKACIIISLVIIIFLFFTQNYNIFFLGLLTLFLEFYTLIKYRNNIILFFVFICLFYFDYSFIISKCISTTPELSIAYSQIKYHTSMFIGVSMNYILHAFLLLFIKEKNKEFDKNIFKNKEITNPNSSRKNLVLIALIFVISVILFDYLFIHVLSIKRTIYEYLLILFIIAFYLAKDGNLLKKVLFVLMMISTFVNMKSGGRIISLQPMIAYFFIMYLDKITSKKISIIVILGIIIFTIAGLYGDILSYGLNSSILNIEYIINVFEQRKFALDTSISAFWTGITFIETTNIVPLFDRISNFFEYITWYTIFGKAANYTQIYEISRQYYVHYYGGYLTSYFYYWGGLLGVISISILITFILNKISTVNKDSSEFNKIFMIYIISSMPRWYLYYPSILIRGTIILFVAYKFIDIFIKMRLKIRK